MRKPPRGRDEGPLDETRRAEFVRAMVESGSVASAAKSMGLPVDAGYHFARNPLVREMFQEARREMFRIGVARAMSLMSKAWDTLHEVMSDRDASPGARTQAAAEALRFCREHLHSDDLELRMRAIEEAEGRESNQSQPGIEATPKTDPPAGGA